MNFGMVLPHGLKLKTKAQVSRKGISSKITLSSIQGPPKVLHTCG